MDIRSISIKFFKLLHLFSQFEVNELLTSDGEYITFEISNNDFVNIIIINNAKLIKINYWKNSKTLCDWTDITRR